MQSGSGGTGTNSGSRSGRSGEGDGKESPQAEMERLMQRQSLLPLSALLEGGASGTATALAPEQRGVSGRGRGGLGRRRSDAPEAPVARIEGASAGSSTQ